jgi:hypothetical protein
VKEFKKVSKFKDDSVYSTSDRVEKTEYSGVGKPPNNYDYRHSISVEDPRVELKRVEEIPLLTHIEARFSQDGNTLGTTEEYEELTIAMEYQLLPEPGKETEGFFTLKTGKGWSIDDPEELVKLIESVKQAAIQIGKIKNASLKKKN